MLICTAIVIGLILILIAANNLLPEDVIYQTCIKYAFSIALGAGIIIGLVAYWLRSESFAEAYTLKWLNYGQTRLALTFQIDTLGAYLIGFYSLYTLLIALRYPSLWFSTSFNRLAGFYTLSLLMVLAGDVITLQVAWLGSIALMAVAFRSNDVSPIFPPLLGGVLLFLSSVLLIIFTRQGTIPDQPLVTSLPKAVTMVIGSLVLTTVLIQTTQFPFPVWMAATWSTENAGGQIALLAGSLTLSSTLLIWKFFTVFQPVHITILAGSGLLTLLLVFYRIHLRTTPTDSPFWLLMSGGIGWGLLSLLIKNSPFLFLMISLLPITLALIELSSTAFKGAEESPQTWIGTKIGRGLLLLVVTGAPLTIIYNLELSLLNQLLQGQLYYPVSWLCLSMLLIGYIAWVGVVIRVAFSADPAMIGTKTNFPGVAHKWSPTVMILSGLMLLYFFYPLPLANLFKPNPMSNFYFTDSPAGQSELRDSTYLWKLNLFLSATWVIVLISCLLLRRRLVFAPLLKIGRSWFYQQLLLRGPDWLACQAIKLMEKCSRWNIRFAQKVAGISQNIFSAVDNAPESLLAVLSNIRKLGQNIVIKSTGKKWLSVLAAGLVLLVIILLLIIIIAK